MIAVDTNVLVYAEGLGDDTRIVMSREVLESIPNKELVFPLQALAELTQVLTRKARLDASSVRERVECWTVLGSLAPTMESTLSSALSLVAEQRLQIFDAIILAASAEADCRLLLSEDMQDGFVWRGVTIANPFAPTLHPMLVDALRT